MASLISYGILGAIVASGAYFLRRELTGETVEDTSDRLAYGDVIRVPTALTSFHNSEG